MPEEKMVALAWESIEAAPARPLEDNWVHRSKGMLCGSCMYWAEKQGKRVGFGRCRRHAPTMSGWPANFATDWCGDHKLDENRT